MTAASWMLNELLKGDMIKVSPGLLAGVAGPMLFSGPACQRWAFPH